MANKYLDFISDEHLLSCIKNLHDSYVKAKENVSKKKFYNNKIDTFKLTFDAHFNNLSEKSVIETEILRQIDKSINNSIGTFHEQVLGAIEGYERGNLSGFDIKAKDDTLFAVFGNTNFSKYVSTAVFEKLANSARFFSKANLYNVLLDDDSNINEKWIVGNEEYHVSHKRVFKISLKQFYAEVTKQENSFEQLFKVIPIALNDYMTIQQPS